ncbi:hypothetical protein [Methylobacterium soli]|jgi:hypothetical protein|uniref:Uncharacterized protein n=1 Tax=Methylobacterium soli TaxID=553447 RepID=A0A6L3T6C8_9HYPH|nr:hypothetical protein [Methylobacterium soli]KAB1080935.1 hypothetical protein F6X53_04445 [Methylobacterium soli]GJE42835.1 hypothetical protein AEGHOMDF_2008 [Methylobacterium soli]
MTSHDECARDLRSYIDHADRDDLGAAQNAILKFALAEPDPQGRAAAMDALLDDLSRDRSPATMSEAQQAFHTVLIAMIERTKTVVGPVTSGR